MISWWFDLWFIYDFFYDRFMIWMIFNAFHRFFCKKNKKKTLIFQYGLVVEKIPKNIFFEFSQLYVKVIENHPNHKIIIKKYK